MDFAVIDIECQNWNEFLGLGFFDGTRYLLFTSLDDYFDYIRSRQNLIIYAHNGGRYDYLFLLDWIESHGLHPSKLLLIESSVVSFQFQSIEYRDSLKILPGSLASIASFFGEKKMEMEYENIASKDWKTYLENDCVILWKTLQRYFEYLDTNFSIAPKVTLASTSMAIYRKQFNGIPEWSCSHEDISREAYLGGRCEIFKFRGKNLLHYDINSMYPFVMHDFVYPIRKPFINKRLSDGDFRFPGFICASVVCPSDLYIPILPIRCAGKMMFFTGKISGVWTLAEMEYAISKGYTIDKVKYVARYHSSEYIFKDWIDYTYNKRMNSTNESERYILKILMNSLYGRFGMAREKEQIVFVDNDTDITGMKCISGERGIFSKPITLDNDSIMPHIAAHVTSYARLELLKYLNQNSYYCDTDSVFTSDTLPHGKKLGQMKLEGEAKVAAFTMPKLYKVQYTNGNKFFKAKGFQKVDSDKFSRIISKEEIQSERMLSFKQCLASQVRFGSKRHLTQALKSAYTKRVRIGNDTRPWDAVEFQTTIRKDG